jgi:hypothetical protein
MNLKTQIMNHEALLGIYTPEARDALMGYSSHLEDERGMLEGRERELGGRLEELEGVKGLKEVGRRVGEIKGEIERVGADIKKLEAEGRV